MKKLRLMLDELAVETFETVKPVERRGTVVGRADSSADRFACAAECSGGCYSDDCFTDFCSAVGCPVTGPDACGPSADYSCVCQSNEWACPDTEACPEVTSFGEATTC